MTPTRDDDGTAGEPGPAVPPGPGRTSEGQPRRSLSRRGLFAGTAGGLAVGAAAGAGVALGLDDRAVAGSLATGADGDDAVDLTARLPYYDQPHPPGIRTPPQRYAVFMTFDLLDGATRTDLQVLLARWSAASAQLMGGHPVGTVQPDRAAAVGGDTGEALGLGPASLTVTVGLGPGVFDRRFGLAAHRPRLLADLPALPSDNLDPTFTGGDLSVQACANDPQVAYHAVRNLGRMVRDTAKTRWCVMGFGRASAGPGQQTPRNLFGFKDGTRNIQSDADYDRFVWVREPSWMTGGSYQMVRKIEMNIEIWDDDPVGDQQHIFGRTKREGAPLTGTREDDPPDFAARRNGKPVIPLTSHVSLAAHEHNDGIKILRRSFNYTDGINQYGQLDAGLLFIVYANDPGHFVRLQQRLGSSDRLNEYISHVGSAIFAVPPTPASGHYVAEELFG